MNVFLSLINENLIKHGLGCPFALSSKLGWIISGKVTFESHEPNRVVVNYSCISTDELVRSFWELENIPSSQLLSTEEKLCEIQFEKNVWRDDHGQYYVALPFKPDRKALGNARVAALRRLYSLERRLATMPDIYNQYRQFMQEYLSLGHMEIISPNCRDLENQHYSIPHYYIIKESSLMTKLIVVFDGSTKSSSGTSLNDTLMIGPKIQEDFISILLTFHCHNIAITSDIKQMYQQVKVRPQDCDFQRIVWRESSEMPIQTFHLNNVTYGTTLAPYLATRALKQLAIDESVEFPRASKIVLRNFCG
ncbi:uncharacterized protein LOC111641355 [Centruroides sculpturatus]|uniref:uncharacterized protein LOC111641355 n=1 Tax=Centruroides sculpturatus TaxID=218467 RepID=UPI000C6CFF9D|nr:uncharacterized protein LOC111641355 [Centruroides sculpturatus]